VVYPCEGSNSGKILIVNGTFRLKFKSGLGKNLRKAEKLLSNLFRIVAGVPQLHQGMDTSKKFFLSFVILLALSALSGERS
jgi:hypothetical protein